jgi:hypothetical protein
MNNDLIRRSDLKAAVDDICYSWGRETEVEGGVLIDLVGKLPAVDAEVVRHGRWTFPWTSPECSVCRKTQKWTSNYCPNCGAKMGGKEDADD